MLTLLVLVTAPLWTRPIIWLLNRYIEHVRGARPSTEAETQAKVKTGTGPMWEQDKPFPECFEEEQDDDL